MATASKGKIVFGDVDALCALKKNYRFLKETRYIIEIGDEHLRPIADWALEGRRAIILLRPDVGEGRFVMRPEERIEKVA